MVEAAQDRVTAPALGHGHLAAWAAATNTHHILILMSSLSQCTATNATIVQRWLMRLMRGRGRWEVRVAAVAGKLPRWRERGQCPDSRGNWFRLFSLLLSALGRVTTTTTTSVWSYTTTTHVSSLSVSSVDIGNNFTETRDQCDQVRYCASPVSSRAVTGSVSRAQVKPGIWQASWEYLILDLYIVAIPGWPHDKQNNSIFGLREPIYNILLVSQLLLS